MVAVLADERVAVAVVQSRLALERLDGELQRLMLTLEGVMRTEFGEGLTCRRPPTRPASRSWPPIARSCWSRPDGALLAMWGLPFPRDWRPDLAASILDTIVVGSARRRLVQPTQWCTATTVMSRR